MSCLFSSPHCDLNSGADDLLLLFAYVIAWGSVEHLHAELQYMDDYMEEKHRCMMTGYYHGQLHCCCSSLRILAW